MVERVGTPEFTQRSIELYGAPRDRIGPNAVTNLEAAEQFLAMTDDFRLVGDPPEEVCLRPEYVAERLSERIRPVFHGHAVTVEIDPDMTSKAAAGATRVRIRGATCFSNQDIAQLAEHEVFVHSLTSINGREQPILRTMGLGSPRTTATQEGMATFAELITNAIDLPRLRRLALRVKAIQLALDGADFIDVFRFFLAAGQTLEESYYSAARVFRGGDVRGRIVFTKDVVYLQGLISVHTFFLQAIHQGRPGYIRDHQRPPEAATTALQHVRGARRGQHREHRVATEALPEVIRGDHAPRDHRAEADQQDHGQRQEGVHQHELPRGRGGPRVGHQATIRRRLLRGPTPRAADRTASASSVTSAVSADPNAARARIGYVPEEPKLYDYLTGREMIEFVAEIRGRGDVEAALDVAGLGEDANRLIHEYSQGMRRKIALAAAMVAAPPVLILDESLNGLDPPSAARVTAALRAARDQGTAVLLSTHVLDTLERLADRLIMIAGGRVVADLPGTEMDRVREIFGRAT